jgi:hypothetical protein
MQEERSVKAMKRQEKEEQKRAAAEALKIGSHLDQSAGVFDPFTDMQGGEVIRPISETSFGFVEETKVHKPTPEELHPETVHLIKEVNDFYNGAYRLKSNNSKASYNKGVSAYKRGDREKLVDALTELQSERRKLIDRNTLLDQTRSRLLMESNKQALIDIGESKFGEIPLFGGGGANKITDLTKKINVAKSEVWKEVNKNDVRMHNLMDKLARLDSKMKPERYEPREPGIGDIVPFKGYRGGGDLWFLSDVDNPLLKKKSNPVTRGGNPVTKEMLKNPYKEARK